MSTFSETRHTTDTVVDHVCEAEHGEHRKILICLNPTRDSEEALKWAITEFIRPSNDLVCLLNVRTPDALPPSADITESMRDEREKKVRDSYDLVKHNAEILKKQGIMVKALSAVGDARAEIRRIVDEFKPNILIIGKRDEKSTLESMATSSVSEHLVRNVKACTVIIARLNESVGFLREAEVRREE